MKYQTNKQTNKHYKHQMLKQLLLFKNVYTKCHLFNSFH